MVNSSSFIVSELLEVQFHNSKGRHFAMSNPHSVEDIMDIQSHTYTCSEISLTSCLNQNDAFDWHKVH